MEHQKALVIAGPQGSGKTLEARRLASLRGAYLEVEGAALDVGRNPLDRLRQPPPTLIVNGAPRTPLGRRALDRLAQFPGLWVIVTTNNLAAAQSLDPALFRAEHPLAPAGPPQPRG